MLRDKKISLSSRRGLPTSLIPFFVYVDIVLKEFFQILDGRDLVEKDRTRLSIGENSGERSSF